MNNLTTQELFQKIQEIDQLRAALLGSITNLTNDEKIKLLEKAQPMVLPGTPECEALLQGGYPGMSVEKAKTIIAERAERPDLWPYDMLEKAQAFLAAYNATDEQRQPTSTRKPWRTRSRV